MDIETLRDYCLAKVGVTESFPFDADTLVLKVMGKMFALTGLDEVEVFKVNLKCDPEKSLDLRERYEDITPGWHMNKITGAYHMNKTHWNTVMLNGRLSRALICEMVDDSYNLVRAGLKKTEREILDGLSGGN